ncbi:hypothetical protein LIER_28573 [Lithospermum erythrorhizon]|uniref:Uncharacterized protein n=1 Tax=Lithospermum erythrorhizon TaxID=34254 RepID=A0AAV3RM33_LITER
MARAQIKQYFYALFLLAMVLFLSYGIMPSEQRELKAAKWNTSSNKCSNYVTNDQKNAQGVNLNGCIGDMDQNKDGDSPGDEQVGVDDFRPTTPGHSPGVGHGDGPKNISSKP